MSFSIKIEREAAKPLSDIPKKDRVRIVNAIDKLGDSPRSGTPLSGKWKGLWRIRVGNYRVIYGMKKTECVILVVRVSHRREVYR